MPTYFEQHGSSGFRAGVRVGDRDAVVVRLEQASTYYGLIEGTPTARMNDELLEPARKAARSRGAYLVEPPRRDFLRRPGDMSGLSFMGRAAEFLPCVSVRMTLESFPASDPDKHYSTLEVFFFQEEFAPPLDDGVAAALRSLDWARHAEDREI